MCGWLADGMENNTLNIHLDRILEPLSTHRHFPWTEFVRTEGLMNNEDPISLFPFNYN